jgi:hypothetical protein
MTHDTLEQFRDAFNAKNAANTKWLNSPARRTMTDADLIHDKHGREALIWILPKQGTISEWPSFWHWQAATAVLDPGRLGALVAAELIRRGIEAVPLLPTIWSHTYQVCIAFQPGSDVRIEITPATMRLVRYALLAVILLPEGATRSDVERVMRNHPLPEPSATHMDYTRETRKGIETLVDRLRGTNLADLTEAEKNHYYLALDHLQQLNVSLYERRTVMQRVVI